MTASSSRQITAIHAIAARVGLDEETRRDIMAAEADGKRSAKDLSFTEAGRVIERLKTLSLPLQTGADPHSNGVPRPLADGAVKLDGPYAGKLRALWISGWNLGVVKNRTDRGLLAFLERQTGVSHPRFLREPREAAKAIEGLKAWIAREAGVAWPPATAAVAVVKGAVIDAQLRRIAILGIPPAVGALDIARDPDGSASALGRQLRGVRRGKLAEKSLK